MDFLEEDIQQTLDTLHKGGTILYPTDTIWGIGCDATNEAAVEKIYELKRRSASKSFVVLVSSEKELTQYATNVNPLVLDFLNKTTKPTTVIYHQVIGFASNVLASDGSVAIRICNDPFCRNLIKRFKKPIISTSANISGMPSPSVFHEVDIQIKDGVNYVVKHRQQENEPAQASSIIQFNQQGEIEVIRP